MKIRVPIRFCLLVAAGLIFTGCGGDTLAPVSGKVTFDGKPVPDLEVVYAPLPVEGNANPGPYSYAMTDAEGHYELKTRHGKTGAIVGKHIVTFGFPDIDPEDMEELEDELDEAESREEAADIMAEITNTKNALKGRPRIPARLSEEGQEVEVSAGGHTDADFELNEK